MATHLARPGRDQRGTPAMDATDFRFPIRMPQNLRPWSGSMRGHVALREFQTIVLGLFGFDEQERVDAKVSHVTLVS